MLTGPLPGEVDHRKLAAEKARIDGLIPIAHFTRLTELIESETGEFAVSLKFRPSKKQRSLVVGSCTGSVTMICQHCLEPFEVPVDAKIRTLVVDAEEDLAALQPDEEGLVCEGEKVALVDLLEDDVIVSLPMVPRHPEGECESPGHSNAGIEERSDTYKPFAGLKELTKDN